MDIDNLEAGRETDALVWLALNSKPGEMTDQGVFGCRYVDGDVQPHAGYPMGHISPPNYSTDIVAACEMEEMIEQRGFNLRYAQALMAVFLFDGLEPECDEELWWAFIDASSIQRCRAALKAVNGGRE